jgi:hypothetical protein
MVATSFTDVAKPALLRSRNVKSASGSWGGNEQQCAFPFEPAAV